MKAGIGFSMLPDAAQAGPGERTYPTAQIRAKGHGIAEIDPLEGDQGNEDKALHDGAEHVFLAHHAAVKKGQSRNHEQHQGRADKDKGRVAALQHIAPPKKFGPHYHGNGAWANVPDCKFGCSLHRLSSDTGRLARVEIPGTPSGRPAGSAV